LNSYVIVHFTKFFVERLSGALDAVQGAILIEWERVVRPFTSIRLAQHLILRFFDVLELVRLRSIDEAEREKNSEHDTQKNEKVKRD
jgi:hypothetical protein